MTFKKAFALLLVFALLGAGVFYVFKIEQNDQQNMRDLYSEVEPLQREREALAEERDSLEIDYALKMRDVATFQLLFREMNEDLFTEVYPLMRDRGIVGVLGISSSQFPGYSSTLTEEQFNRLLMDGWGICYIFDGTQSFDYWFNTISFRMETNEITAPTAIYFADNSYDSSMNETLIEHGIKTVILPAENGRSSTVTSMDGPLWFTGAMPWNYTGVMTDTELLARTESANLTFTMSFETLWDAYEKESFIKILDNWAEMLDVDDPLKDLAIPTPTPNPADPDAVILTPEEELIQPLLKTTNFETAREAHKQAKEQNAELQKELEDRQSTLDAQIASLDEQIRAVYDKWQQADINIGRGFLHDGV